MSTQGIPTGRKIILACIVFSLVTLALTSISDQLERWELDTLTFRQRLVHEPRHETSPITLVGLDEKAHASAEMNTLFGKKPWNRRAYAYVTRFMERAGARKVLYDLSFDGGKDDDREHDLAFKKSLEASNRFSSGILFLFNRHNKQSPDDFSPAVQQMLKTQAVQAEGLEHFRDLQRHRAFGLLPPLDELAPVMDFYSAAGSLADISGNIRYWIPVTLYEDNVYPGHAIGILFKEAPVKKAPGNRHMLSFSKNGELAWEGRKIKIGHRGIPVIKWYGNQATQRRDQTRIYPEVSIWDVIQSELVLSCPANHSADPNCGKVALPEKPPLDPAQFRDRYVLVGETSSNMFDRHQTIYDGINKQQYPGVYIVANILDNVIHDDFVLPVPAWLNWLLGLLGCGLVVWMVFKLDKITNALMGTVLLMTGHSLLATGAYLYANAWLNIVYPLAGMGACFSGGYVYRYLKARKAREQLRYAFGKYVSPSVMQVIEKNPEAIRLGGTRQEMTMLFCDIRGFTTYSENHSPEEVQAMLSQYFTIMNNIILNKYQGTINKLIGDAIFAYWGFPLKTDEHALLAVSAALSMKHAIEAWQKDPDKPFVDIGIGIHTGEVMVGNVGSEDFMDFTLIGDAVNTAAQLESLNKEMKTRIIISEDTFRHIDTIVKARPLGSTKVKGKEIEVGIYEPTSLSIRP